MLSLAIDKPGVHFFSQPLRPFRVEPMKLTLVLILLALATGFSAPADAQLLRQPQTESLDRIAAVVDARVVLESDLEQAVQTVLRQFADTPEQLPPRDVLRRQVLDRLILQELQLGRAHENGIRVQESEVKNAVQGIAAENQLSVEQLRGALAQQGISYRSFRQQIADQIMVQKNRQQVLQESVEVSDAEIDNMLDSPSLDPGEAHLRHILIGIPEGASAEDIAAASAEAAEVKAMLADGADFGAAAIRYSDAPDALEGGDLGWRKMSELPRAFTESMASLQAGQASEPMRGPRGFHIIQLLDKRDQARNVVTEYHARHIMLTPDVLMTLDQAEQKIIDLRKRIVDEGEEFAVLAKEFSDDDTTANAGGDMGWFPIDAWGAGITAQLTQLDDGEISAPFRTEGGWHILQLLDTRAQDRTEEMLRQQARQAIQTRKAEEFFNNYLREMRALAYIDIRLGTEGETAETP